MWASISVLITAFVVNSVRTQAVYAGFAIAVIALIWIYLNWIVLLLGAQIAFYVQHPAYLRFGRQEVWLSNSTRERLALNIMLIVGQAHRDPGTTINVERLSTQLGMPSLTLAPVIEKLEQGGLLTANEDECLLPGREVARMTIEDVLAVVRAPELSVVRRPPRWDGEVTGIAKEIDVAISRAIGTRTLSDVLDAVEDREETAAKT
jgi:membrane protein